MERNPLQITPTWALYRSKKLGFLRIGGFDHHPIIMLEELLVRFLLVGEVVREKRWRS